MRVTLAVIGGGSAGVAAALAAARLGVDTALIERGEEIGGTAIHAGIHCWEPGVGGTGIPFDLYRRLKSLHPDAVGIYRFGRHFCWQDGWYWPHRPDLVNFPGGEMLIDPSRTYRDSLRRHPGPGQPADEAFCRAHWHGVVFEPEMMAAAQRALLEETGRVRILTGTGCRPVEFGDGMVRHAVLDDGSTLQADYWVDASGGALCADCGCEMLWGREARARFQEPGAPAEPSDKVNGVTLIYRITPATAPAVEPLPSEIPTACWWTDVFPAMSCYAYPNGDRNCNTLPTMEGEEWRRLGDEAAYAECRRRVRAHWHFLQATFPEFRHYRLGWIAPRLGIREGRRVVCEYMLTEYDLRRGLPGQTDADLIAIADHPLDRHGEGGGCPELDAPYGIPYRSLIPRGWRNLLVAGRAAGFSSIAASSCRLTRTMMQLGQAAGTAVALAQGHALPEVSPTILRACLRQQHVQLSWPLEEDLQAYLAEHDPSMREGDPD